MGGGGGGGGSSQFKAQGPPPGFDYQQAMGLQQLATGADIQSYALSDQDFANRYPALQDAYQQWQANLGTQLGQAAQGQAGTAQIMGGLGGQILGRQGAGTTADINAVRNAAATAAGAVGPIYGLGAAQAGLAPGIIGAGQQQMGLAPGLVGMGQQQAGIGTGINRLGGQLAGRAQIPYQVGLNLLNEPVDPITQQQMMKAGLTGAAGSMGAASLGQGMAGQAAAARQLGLSTLQYGQAMRGEAMQDINQYASMLGAAGQMRGLGAQTIGAGAQTVGLGGQQLATGAGTIGLGGQQLGQGAQTYGLGAQTAQTAGNLSAAAQGLQEGYGMNTAQMAGIYGGLQSQQNQALLSNIATSGQMFQKRPFGLGGVNLAQTELGQAGAYNSFQQANYATMNGIAYNQAQMNAQQNQLQQQQQAGMVSAGVGVATTAATTGATIAAMSCWVARAVYPDNRWKIFRHWLLNKAPASLRHLYLQRGEAFSRLVYGNAALRFALKLLMDQIVERTAYVGCPG
jgi:hypothetical protein